MGAKNAKGQVKYKHHYFDQVYKRESYGKQLITIIRPIMNEAQYRDWKNIYEEAKDMNRDALFIPEQEQYRKMGKTLNCCCGADSEVQLTYQNFDYLLGAQLQNRRRKNISFKETELFFILYKLLEGSKEFQIRGKSVGDIRPQNIVYTKSGDIKMINLASFPWEKTSMDKILDYYDNRTIFYLAPEQIRSLSAAGRGNFPNSKTQCFSIGLVLLQAATLQSSEDFYKPNPRTINLQKLNQNKNKIQQIFPKLAIYIYMALEEDASKRPSSGQLWACLKCHSQKITQLKDFSPNKSAENASIQQFRRNKSVR